MSDEKKLIEVVGAVIRDDEGRILCALRSATMSQPGLWEFPGGKIDLGELPEVTLVREIEEELGCRIEVGELVADCTYAYPAVTIRLRTYWSRIVDGEAAPTEHEKVEWLGISDLVGLAWAPADIPTVDVLRQLQDAGTEAR
jgi:8-oxo-dGTP diphosphatase